MKDIFKKSPRRLRKEKKQRQEERSKEKEQLQNLKKMFTTKESKVKHLKRIERSPSFQNDFNKMKSLLVNTKPLEPKKQRPMENFVKDFNIFKKNDDFLKTKKNKKTEDDFWRL